MPLIVERVTPKCYQFVPILKFLFSVCYQQVKVERVTLLLLLSVERVTPKVISMLQLCRHSVASLRGKHSEHVPCTRRAGAEYCYIGLLFLMAPTQTHRVNANSALST